MTEREARLLSTFNLALLNRGILAASYGLMALSLPMTDADVDQIIGAVSDALAEVVATT
jgi:glutamate-1-semialdehyde 2,1-aminomutase